jgi:hypothetical protein
MTNKSKNTDTITVIVYVEKITARALLCTEVDNLEDADSKSFWLPTSQIEIVFIDSKKSWYTINVPEWLATEKGLT